MKSEKPLMKAADKSSVSFGSPILSLNYWTWWTKRKSLLTLRSNCLILIDNRYQERVVANGSLMMCEVQGAKEDFIRRWNSIFKEYPDVFEDSDCRKIIYDLTEDAVQYLLKIKEKTL